MNRFFITGTDTGVGKTVATTALARGLKQAGNKVLLHKPIETGGTEDISSLAKVADNKELLYSYVFDNPLAPNVAAKLENREVSWEHIKSNIKRLESPESVLLIEGAGGLLVPITDSKTYLDLASELELQTIVVAANKLGVINHFSLTLRVLSQHKIHIAGYIVSEVDETALSSNREQLARVASGFGAPELGYLPFTNDVTEFSLCPNL